MTDPASHGARCPFRHSSPDASDRKSSRAGEALTPPFEVDGARWTIRSFGVARSILREGEATRQAGFSAETLERTAQKMRPPVLYQEGGEHKAQRGATARFFTPQTVGRDYHALMEAVSDELVAELAARKEADLSQLSMKLSVRVVAQVVGLTNSPVRALGRRLETFFEDGPSRVSWRPAEFWRFLRTQSALLRFFYGDVKPAIRARRRAPREDVISHLLEKGYGDVEILTECVTYAAAGMLTTREFIVMAAWHLLEKEPLRRHYLAADEAGRQHILQEILRLEPVVGHLYRRTTRPLTLSHEGETFMVPAGALIDLDLRAINADAKIVGEAPLQICPARPLARGVPGPVMSFGDGHHRCPGAYLALQESDIFLSKLLKLPLTAPNPPQLSWNDLVAGYDLKGFVVRMA